MPTTDSYRPLYIPNMEDSFRLDTFAHIVLPTQDKFTTTIARIERNDEGAPSLSLFFPLFPKKKLACHPDIPDHDITPITRGAGAKCIELYKASVSIHGSHPITIKTEILYPAFVTNQDDLADPKNAWAEGMRNVYVVRFRQKKIHGVVRLVPIRNEEVRCFPTDWIKRAPDDLIICPRCLHKSIWTGLFQLRKAIVKILNRRSGAIENRQTQSLSIGTIPLEVFNYIHVVANSTVHSLTCHSIRSTESYLTMDSNLTRHKLKFKFKSGFMRFISCNDLNLLRQFLGIAAVYGSTEARPTLTEGDSAQQLKRGHTLTVVRGQEESESPQEFKRRSKQQRIDFIFSPHQVRVTVAFEKYHYDTLRSNGSLKHAAPTPHLQGILTGTGYKDPPDTVLYVDHQGQTFAEEEDEENSNDDLLITSDLSEDNSTPVKASPVQPSPVNRSNNTQDKNWLEKNTIL